ncbi:Mu-like prophage FluMu protein gp42 [Vibrio maritimus]|uniref:Mu-like prophage FluMu protein gp42 n=1 Tax=Vibrio maritimus TaxID=990268 RepID=A0A090S8U4_9VIBR|nr:Mu-like prophage FluMu protein gp42 [Vibrio maritimus]
MSNNAGNISVGLVLNGADAFIGRVNKSAKSLDKYGRAVKTSTSHNDTFLHQMRDAAIILGLARSALENLSLLFTGLPRAIISQNAQLERAQILIAGMDTSAHSYSDALEDAKNTVNDLVNLSSSSPFSVQAITDSFAKLKAADIQNTTDALDSMVNAAAQAGANSEGLKRFTVAIQQMAGKGVLSMEELRQQAGEAVPQIMQLMANATAMRMDEMVKKISSGTVEAKSAINELVKEMTFAAMGSAEAMAQTLEGINNRIRNDFTMLAKEVGDSGFTETIKEIGNELDELLASPEAKAAAREFGDILSGVTRSLYDLSIAITENIKLIGTLVAILISSKVLGNASTGLSAIFKQAKLDAADYTASVDKFMTHTDRRISEVSRRIVSNQKAAVAATQSWVSRQTNVTTQQAAAWHRELEASMNKSHNAQIQKLQKLQKAYTSTGRQLWNVGKGIVNAMGGWTTAISVGIMGALYLMDEFIWKQKRAADEIIRTQGIGATAENITYAKKELEKLNEKLVVLKKIRNEINSGEREADGFELMHYNKQIKEIESRTKELNHAIEKGQSDMSAMAFDSGLSGSARLMYKELKEISATYKKEEKALREDLENQGLRGDAFEEALSLALKCCARMR